MLVYFSCTSWNITCIHCQLFKMIYLGYREWVNLVSAARRLQHQGTLHLGACPILKNEAFIEKCEDICSTYFFFCLIEKWGSGSWVKGNHFRKYLRRRSQDCSRNNRNQFLASPIPHIVKKNVGYQREQSTVRILTDVGEETALLLSTTIRVFIRVFKPDIWSCTRSKRKKIVLCISWNFIRPLASIISFIHARFDFSASSI